MKFTSAPLLAAALALGVGHADVAHADDAKIVAVSVEAEAPFTGDVAAAEKEAKRQARRKAIEEGAGTLVTSNSIMRNYELISDEIATSAKGVLLEEKWGPLENGPTGSTKKIKLQAKVSREAVADSICTVVKANHNPKVTMVFVEKTGDEDKWSTERGLVEALFAQAFVDSCFTLVEPGVKVTEVSANGDLPQETINEIIKNSDAQYVVLGSAKMLKSKSALLGDPDSKMQSFGVVASVKMINTANNEIEAVATSNGQALGVSLENAMKMSATKQNFVVSVVMDQLMKKVSARWTSDMVNTAHVSVIVQNVPNFAAANAFKELAAKLNMKPEQRKVSGGSASYDFDADGGAEAVAGAIEGKKAGKYTIEVIEVTAGKVILKLN